MTKFGIAALLLAALGSADAAFAGDAGDAIALGAKIVAVTPAPDGRFHIALQGDKWAMICLLDKPKVGNLNTESCYRVK
ncbi:hypothetical protein SAMN05216374_2323 [Tardiphaga sp. OK246]|jgi:membrane protein implicated in regulation of membrane protease activity|uniref:hypothetical protein n=1 Tax=Tardiphaga sp. OK246 TaxID=1855307 RepID=UPI000B6828EE|nr:hypothetical protein [Tardiphaga sp. OK246]SNT01806.1 hypothetical protein SAMN05216374_2323 [Tardiphaga sp. OK246]